MALTSFANVFASIDDSVIDALANKLLRDRPMWFNYGDAAVAAHPETLCQVPNVDSSIPSSALVKSIQIPATVNGGQTLGTLTVPALNFCAQITSIQIDFAPGDIISLPPELNPPLPAQRLAIHVGLAAGLGDGTAATPSLHCFTLDLYLIAGVAVNGQAPLNQPVTLYIHPIAQNIEIGGLAPDGLRDSVRILLTTFAQTLCKYINDNGGIVFFKKIDVKDIKIKINPFPAPTGSGLPANPALEQNQFMIFADLNVAP
jgi:hypothetical protein